MTDNKNCDFCNNKEIAYGIISSSHSEKVTPGYNSVVTLGIEGRKIGLECTNYDPNYGSVHTKIDRKKVFRINYCPNCGRKLGGPQNANN